MKNTNQELGLFVCFLLLCFSIISCCRKECACPDKEDTTVIQNPKKDKWQSEIKKDSLGNQYSYAVTYEDKLELRIKKPDGSLLLSHVYKDVDPLEKVEREYKIIFVLTVPNKRISSNLATVAVRIDYSQNPGKKEYRSNNIITNVDLDTRQFFTKIYKVSSAYDTNCVLLNSAIVQWYNGSILVREGIAGELEAIGGLGTRGSRLVCYNWDFSTRYTKPIELDNAHYPSAYDDYMPISDTKYIIAGVSGASTGTIAKSTILTSRADSLNGVAKDNWIVDFKRMEQVPPIYKVKIDDYVLVEDKIKVTYSVFNEANQFVRTVTRNSYISNGAPADRL